MQHQINELKDINRRRQNEIETQSKEGLCNDQYLAQGDISKYQCEVPAFKVDYNMPHLNKPRMLTIKQIRDVFYSLWNNTVALGRIGESEAHI